MGFILRGKNTQTSKQTKKMTHLSHNLLEFMALQDSFPLITLSLASLLAAYFGIKGLPSLQIHPV